MTLQIRLAVRDWDYIVPLALGDVVAEGLDLRIDRVPALPEDGRRSALRRRRDVHEPLLPGPPARLRRYRRRAPLPDARLPPSLHHHASRQRHHPAGAAGRRPHRHDRLAGLGQYLDARPAAPRRHRHRRRAMAGLAA
ncbi:hypothetical protein WJ970_16020 [Achromobacter xylosoxidans]